MPRPKAAGLQGGVAPTRIVVNHGTVPPDELDFALKPLSSTRGAVDREALRAGWPQPRDADADAGDL